MNNTRFTDISDSGHYDFDTSAETSGHLDQLYYSRNDKPMALRIDSDKQERAQWSPERKAESELEGKALDWL